MIEIFLYMLVRPISWEVCLKCCIYVLVFVLLDVEDGNLETKIIKSQKLPVFCHEIKSRT